MKARVKATGEFVEVHTHSYVTELVKGGHPRSWMLTELEIEEMPDPDYWTRLEHQYAGMAMQGILANYGVEPLPDDVANDAYNYAHALIQKLKESK